MELGRASMYILFVMLCIDAAAIMIDTVGVEGTPVSAWNQTQYGESMNTTKTVEEWSWQTAFWDIAFGLTTWWYKSVPIIESFPAMLAAYGCPDFIYNPLHNIWRTMWMTTVALVIIAGRRV